ncbi:MAG TPA: homoserine O-acetyltransferase [Planctomycetota bacterium]|nr:homoserine O-acetyltransferase [Planctomycetota bacterium]
MTTVADRYAPPDSPASVGWTEARTVRLASAESPLRLESGGSIGPVDVEYETYGELSARRDNAVLVAHALSGDAHAAGWDRNADATGRLWRARRPGWWDEMIGPGKPIDTRRFFVVCANVLGSCYGTTGPASLDPASGRPYGLRFPMITVGDWVQLQARLVDRLGIGRLHAVVGGSLGGQQALEWALAFPERVARCVVLAAAPRLSSQGVAFNAVGRYAIMNDPHFAGGDYYGAAPPRTGLAAARMLAHITYLSEEGMSSKFGRRLRKEGSAPDFGFGAEFEVESYLNHQGRGFVERFDANSYLYITRAMDYYDAAVRWGDGDLSRGCARIRSSVLVASFSSDWLYTPGHCKDFALAMCRAGRTVTYVEAPSRYGHDAFLVEKDRVGDLLRHFLAGPLGEVRP